MQTNCNSGEPSLYQPPLCCSSSPPSALAQTYMETSLYAFGSTLYHISEWSSDDSTGNLMGPPLRRWSTTCFYGCGIVYKLSIAQEPFYIFTDGTDGASPSASWRSTVRKYLRHYGVAGEGRNRIQTPLRENNSILYRFGKLAATVRVPQVL